MHKKKIHKWIGRVFRIAVVAVIFLFLYLTGQLEPSKLKQVWIRPEMFGCAAGLIYLGILITVGRWRTLLKAQGISIGFWAAWKLTFIGHYFSTAIPGSVSGDIVKAYYLAKGRQKKAVLVTTVLFDRLLGVYTMFLFSSAAILSSAFRTEILGYSGLWTQPSVKTLGLFVGSLFIIFTVAGILCMSPRFRNSRFVVFLLAKMPFHKTITKVYDAIHNYGKKTRFIITALLYSLIAQAFIFSGMFLLCVLLGIDHLNPVGYFFALPVCLMLNSIPLAPGGLGIGEVGFQGVFLLLGSDKGAELAVLFHVIFFFLAIALGGAVYLFSDLSHDKITAGRVVE